MTSEGRQDQRSAEASARGSARSRALALVLLGLVALVAIGLFGLGWYWSWEPEPIDPTAGLAKNAATGVVTTDALIGVTRTLLDKPGGFLRNDVMPPGVLMDNMPSFEYGALVQVRNLVHVLRNEISRSQAQSPRDPDLAIAEPPPTSTPGPRT